MMLYYCVIGSLLIGFSRHALAFECSMSAFENELHTKVEQMDRAFTKLQGRVQHLLTADYMNLAGRGSSYIRLGRSSCSGNGTRLIYKGHSGGSHYDKGGAANFLCLPEDPDWLVYDSEESKDGATIYGTEYQFELSPSSIFAGTPVAGTNAINMPCAVCEAPRQDVLMIPAKLSCPHGWNLEYTGYLAAGLTGYPAPSEYVCLDGRPEAMPGKPNNDNENLIYIVEARCGTLPCRAYPNGRELTCVVCSK